MPKVVWKQHTGGFTKAWRGFVSGKWIATVKLTPAGKFRRHWRERFWSSLPTVEARDAKSFSSYEEAVADAEQWIQDFWKEQ